MIHEKEVIKPEGKYYLKISVSLGHTRANYEIYTLQFIPKGKRKRLTAIDTYSFEYTRRSFPEGRMEYVKEQIDSILTKEEQAQAYRELYELLKPEQI